MKIEFPEIIKKKFFEMITNIYYLTTKRAYIKYMNEFYPREQQRPFKERSNTFNMVYRQFLKGVRNEVFSFFKVPHEGPLPPKILLRVYAHTFSPSHEIAIKYEKLKLSIDSVQTKMIDELFIEFYNDNGPFAIKEPIDRVIDFDQILERQSKFINPVFDSRKGANSRVLETFANYPREEDLFAGKNYDDETN
jgi:hypothetical protein